MLAAFSGYFFRSRRDNPALPIGQDHAAPLPEKMSRLGTPFFCFASAIAATDLDATRETPAANILRSNLTASASTSLSSSSDTRHGGKSHGGNASDSSENRRLRKKYNAANRATSNQRLGFQHGVDLLCPTGTLGAAHFQRQLQCGANRRPRQGPASLPIVRST